MTFCSSSRVVAKRLQVSQDWGEGLFRTTVGNTNSTLSFAIQTVARALSTNTSSTLIVNAVGLDRPGIVSDVTKYVTDAGGNVGQSQAAKLGEYFSIMMQIEVPAKEVDDLKNSLTSMSGMNTSIFETEGKPKVSSRPKIACE